MEQFVESGFAKDVAIKLINSVLLLKSEKTSFSTLDICSVDLYSGRAEFIKIGAASAFVIRDGEVRGIQSSSLPVGILESVDVEKSEMSLKDGDIILMASDGVMDVLDPGCDEEDWVREKFQSLNSMNPQDIADYFLIEARKKAGEPIRDDMTVLAARIWERYQ